MFAKTQYTSGCLFYLITILLSGSSFTNRQYNNSNHFLQNLVESKSNHDSLILQRKVVIPAQIQKLIPDFPNNITYVELKQSPWFDGVEDVCKYQVIDWMLLLILEDVSGEDNKWVLQMIDAWGKIPEGVLAGHTNSYGDFDQCIGTTAYINQTVLPSDYPVNSFDGMYCTSYLIPLPSSEMNTKAIVALANFTTQESISFREFLKRLSSQTPSFSPLLPSIGTCLPNTCSPLDVQTLLANGLAQLLKNSGISIIPMTIDCTDKHKPPLGAGAIAMITILAVLVVLAVISGIMDYFQTHYTKDTDKITSKQYRCFKAFSAYSNTKRLLSTRTNADDIRCLHGIRFLSTAWIVLGHTYMMFLQGPQWNRVDIDTIYKSWTEMAVMNATFSVDTFFLMSGLLVTYNILKMLDKTKGRLNMLMLYVHRYIRLTPSYAILVGISANLLSYAGNGPNWWGIMSTVKFCQDNWWTNLLYINNIVKSGEMCNGQSWYLANDMQFFVLAPFIVYPMWKSEAFGRLLLILYTTASCLAPVLVVWYWNTLPGAFITRPGDMNAFGEIYVRPWSRIAPFLVGVWLGWTLHKTKGGQMRLHKAFVSFAWLVSAAVALGILFGVLKWFDPEYKIPTLGGYFYAGLGRLAWAVAIAWVIFACIKGYGGVVNEFLSWRAFMPLGRLCFCVYLTSSHLQELFHRRLTLPVKWDTYTVVNIYFAHMVMSYFAGFLCTLLFESPFMVLQKLVFEKPTKQSKHNASTSKHDL